MSDPDSKMKHEYIERQIARNAVTETPSPQTASLLARINKWVENDSTDPYSGGYVGPMLAEAASTITRLEQAIREALPFMAGVCFDHPDTANHQCAHTHRRNLTDILGDPTPWDVALLSQTPNPQTGEKCPHVPLCNSNDDRECADFQRRPQTLNPQTGICPKCHRLVRITKGRFEAHMDATCEVECFQTLNPQTGCPNVADHSYDPCGTCGQVAGSQTPEPFDEDAKGISHTRGAIQKVEPRPQTPNPQTGDSRD